MRRVDYRKISSAFIVVAIAAGILYDILPALSRPDGDTISEIIRDWSSRRWGLPFGFGVLAGHFFGPAPWFSPLWYAVPLWALIAAGLIFQAPPVSPAHTSLFFALGAVSGAVFWSLGGYP